MSPPEVWGPPIWTFFHTLAEKINEDYFLNIKHSLFHVIKRICKFLPCPDCSQHATNFLAKININKINSKLDFKNMLYVFHNTVNKRKKKLLFSYAKLDIYKNYNIGSVFNHFISVYNTNGNMNLIAESFQRNMLIKDLKNWLIRNHHFFKPKKIPLQHSQNIKKETRETSETSETNKETQMKEAREVSEMKQVKEANEAKEEIQ
jgi:hypothetical protein